MNGICFCVNLFKFDGFTVQQGMIYGTYRGRKFVTNGLKCGQPQGKGRYYPVYFQRMNEALETSWERCALSFYDDPILFDKIERMAEKREAKGRASLSDPGGAGTEEVGKRPVPSSFSGSRSLCDAEGNRRRQTAAGRKVQRIQRAEVHDAEGKYCHLYQREQRDGHLREARRVLSDLEARNRHPLIHFQR
ncbi:hypothetical protein CE91St46_09250 [Eubacteriales bacterium]|nr:hypothetical protein CE91St46_09250 [Eubacteriales bacterium]GKH62450.1 hypothetical protein CE91St47_09190 [Eubacteriales bacterium]